MQKDEPIIVWDLAAEYERKKRLAQADPRATPLKYRDPADHVWDDRHDSVEVLFEDVDAKAVYGAVHKALSITEGFEAAREGLFNLIEAIRYPRPTNVNPDLEIGDTITGVWSRQWRMGHQVDVFTPTLGDVEHKHHPHFIEFYWDDPRISQPVIELMQELIMLLDIIQDEGDNSNPGRFERAAELLGLMRISGYQSVMTEARYELAIAHCMSEIAALNYERFELDCKVRSLKRKMKRMRKHFYSKKFKRT